MAPAPMPPTWAVSTTPPREVPAPTATTYAYAGYASVRPPHIDLGYIGDAKIGLGPQPHHKLQEWEKPFRLGGGWSRGWGRIGRR